jgi:hypothetical protein
VTRLTDGKSSCLFDEGPPVPARRRGGAHQARLSPAQFLLVREGSLRSEFMETMRLRGFDGSFTPLEDRHTAPDHMMAAMVCLTCPTLNEGLPLMEAQAAGLPCSVSEGISRGPQTRSRVGAAPRPGARSGRVGGRHRAVRGVSDRQPRVVASRSGDPRAMAEFGVVVFGLSQLPLGGQHTAEPTLLVYLGIGLPLARACPVPGAERPGSTARRSSGAWGAAAYAGPAARPPALRPRAGAGGAVRA